MLLMPQTNYPFREHQVHENATILVEDTVRTLQKRYGKPTAFGKSRLYQFGDALTCSINYSKRLRGEKYFFGLAQEVVDPRFEYPETRLGAFVVRAHVKIQSGLIHLGRAEGCSVWVPPNDRNLSYKGESFASVTLERL